MNQPISRHVDFRLVPLGVTVTEGGCYFSVWSPNAEQIVVHLYDKSEHEIRKVISAYTPINLRATGEAGALSF